MPVIRVYKHRLDKLVGRTLSVKELEELLFNLKCEVSVIDENTLEVELNSDRPDMLMTEGIARAIKGLLELELGIPEYTVINTDIVVYVDPPPTRPYIAVATIYNVNIDYEMLEELIQFQEKLHTTYGRMRRRIAIGLHDLDKLPSKTLYYREVNVDEVRFIPLHDYREYTAREVIENTKQGKEYGHISIREDKYHPMLFSGDKVIAMPPVINADITRVEPGTRNLLVDVTGTDKRYVEETIDLITTMLAESGGRIGRVRVVYPRGEGEVYPKLRTEVMRLNIEYARRVLGLDIPAEDLKHHLERMRFNARVSNGNIEVTIPPYRVDILHPIDLVEDIAMSIGYNNIEPLLPSSVPPTPLPPKYRFINTLRELLVGLGFQELHLYMLTSSKSLAKIGVEEKDVVRIANPITEELDALRPTMLNQLLIALRDNQHVDMPVKIFSIGDVVIVDEDKETKTNEKTILAIAYMSGKASFEDLQAPLFAAMRLLGFEIKTIKTKHKLTIDGRTASLVINNVNRGFIGEVKPEVLEELGIKYPVVIGEIDLTNLWTTPVKQ